MSYPAQSFQAPPFDPELAPVLAAMPQPASTDVARLVSFRAPTDVAAVDRLLKDRGLVRTDHQVPGLDGDPEVTVSAIRRKDHQPGGPGLYFAHGGGMVMGDRFSGLDRYLDWVAELDVVAVTVEYRLAPEHPDPAPLHDTYAGLSWTAAHAAELGFDPAKLVAVGLSAGGGLVAGAVLLARDRANQDGGGPAPAAQVLLCPMLDDRNETVSARQIDGIGVWDRSANAAGWTALLGGRRGAGQVPVYSAPARAADLSGLPPTFIDCGSAEVFRDECVRYASAIWAAGGVAELHVWAGGFHGYDGIAPQAAISAATRDARTRFLRRVLDLPGPGTRILREEWYGRGSRGCRLRYLVTVIMGSGSYLVLITRPGPGLRSTRARAPRPGAPSGTLFT